jgi:cytochrome P450
MLHHQDKVTQSQLSDREILDNIITFLLAGIDTTALSLSYTLYCVALNDDIQTKIIEELDSVLGDKLHPEADDYEKLAYTRAVVDEGLRLYPVIPMHVRVAANSDDAPFGHVRKGDAICVPSWVTHVRADLWDDPETFKPERFLGASAAGPTDAGYMPFGLGPHRCIGHVFAKRILGFAVASMVREFHLDVPDTFDLDLKATPVLHPGNGILLKSSERLAQPERGRAGTARGAQRPRAGDEVPRQERASTPRQHRHRAGTPRL